MVLETIVLLLLSPLNKGSILKLLCLCKFNWLIKKLIKLNALKIFSFSQIYSVYLVLYKIAISYAISSRKKFWATVLFSKIIYLKVHSIIGLRNNFYEINVTAICRISQIYITFMYLFSYKIITWSVFKWQILTYVSLKWFSQIISMVWWGNDFKNAIPIGRRPGNFIHCLARSRFTRQGLNDKFWAQFFKTNFIACFV